MTQQLTHRQISRIVQGITLAMFLGALDQTIVATALPTIGRHFHNLEDLAWVVTAYLLTGTAATPLLGKLSDMYGRRAVMLSAVAIFIVGSIACALAPSMTALILARAFQGFGGGALIALAQTVIADIVSPRERGRYQGYIAAVFALSSVGGPVLGGFLTEHIDWSLIFWINVPLGALALGMTWHMLKLVPFHKREHKLDGIGAVLMMLASVALLLALSSGGARYPWLSPQIAALVAASAVLWALFAWRLARAEEPFLPLNILGNKVVRAATLAGACTMGTLVGMTIFVPLYFEGVMGLSATQSGLALIPMLAAVTAASLAAGQALMRMTHYKRIPIVGNIASIAALAVLAIWPAGLSLLAVLALMSVVGLGFGMVFPVSTVCMQNAVERPQMGIATGAANFFRALFAALVVAILGAIVLGGLGSASGSSVEMLARSASAQDLAFAFRLVFIACAVVVACGLGFIIALDELPLRGPSGPAVEPH
ncbi:MDR family MFS transporter [Undibacter mobilis]|uniref:MFS transporter n=1 Tax=Undibacter mobilis TaxID=2292256 RepID=A0A371B3J8_9BRAD|nr:MDR family MFS transporter [Undibacter mobilis]RDV02166.1 MFS transporter [Undibacter mobilis]